MVGTRVHYVLRTRGSSNNIVVVVVVVVMVVVLVVMVVVWPYEINYTNVGKKKKKK